MGVDMTRVEGEAKGNVVIYTLSTCGWCKKTKNLLKELGIGYSYVDVDLLLGPDREQAMEEVQKWNPRGSFPTIIINNSDCILGFNEEKIREALGL